MKDKITNQTISGGFIFVIGIAMFTLLGGNYKKPMLFGSIYIIAIIVQFFLMKKIRIKPISQPLISTNCL